ncbi:hypothetical protein, partial [Niastella populi]|uniref:hypothetical protein n=1 Tax=Niastella populi TaxID=550983 RepID=UPI0013FD9C97
TLAKLAIKRKMNNNSTQLSEILEIKNLHKKWYTYPYIFYRIIDDSKEKTIAYRGLEIGEGIASKYELLKPEIAHTVATLFMQLISPNGEDFKPNSDENIDLLLKNLYAN